jgi:succinate dehydrogenase / fumarate reductase cytochrome b subunit
LLYGIGIVSAVYHLSNGLWTQGITWGIWTTPAAMRRAGRCCFGFGLIVGFIGLAALYGFSTVDVSKARTAEQNIETLHRIQTGELSPSEVSSNAEVSQH